MSMLDDDQLETEVRDLLIDICEVMYLRRYELVNVGALMRLVGVGEERAREHDTEYFALDSDFEKILALRDQRRRPNNNKKKARRKTQSGATLH